MAARSAYHRAQQVLSLIHISMNHKDDSNLVITGQIAASPYRLTLSIAYRQIFSGLTRMFTVIISAAVFIALMMLGIAWLLTRSVTVPVTRLSLSLIHIWKRNTTEQASNGRFAPLETGRQPDGCRPQSRRE